MAEQSPMDLDDFDFDAISAHMEQLLERFNRAAGGQSLRDLIASLEPPPSVMQARSLMALAEEIDPQEDGEPTRGKTAPPEKRDAAAVRSVWDELKRDGCRFGMGNVIVARVSAVGEPGVYHYPDEFPAERVRVYHVDRGVEMCLSVKNFMTKSIIVEPFYVDTDESEASEGPQELPALGRSQMELKSELGEGEVQDGWRLKSRDGEVILTVYMRYQSA